MKIQNITLTQYIENLQMHGQYWLNREETIKKLNISKNAFKLAAYRLSQKGKLKRVRNNFFIIVPPEHRAIGALPATWFIDELMKYFNCNYYVGLLTAASLHGIAHQQPMVFQVITEKPIRPITIGKVQLQFHCKNMIQADFYQLIKTKTGMMKIGTPEITAFDIVKFMQASGQINHVATVLLELTEVIDSKKLTMLINNKSVEISTAQRLGYLLNLLKSSLKLQDFKNALNTNNPSNCLLVPSSKDVIIEYDTDWHIKVNEQVEPDDL